MYWSDGDEDSVAVSALLIYRFLAAAADAIDSGSLAMSDGLLFGYTTATRGVRHSGRLQRAISQPCRAAEKYAVVQRQQRLEFPF
jgi:hypothetical protein